MTKIDGSVLEGVSATALWTLRSRALESQRPDGVLHDPWAEHLFDSIAFDYAMFGKPTHYHVVRALAFDRYIHYFLRQHPGAAVVSLAEGFQTSFWRLQSALHDAGSHWYSVDLAPVMALREKLLPTDARLSNVAASALDRTWMDRIDGDRPVLITAEGLLMYLPPDVALNLIADCARRFPGGKMIFDSIPPSYSRRTLRGLKLSKDYTLPPMPFSLSSAQSRKLPDTVPGVNHVHKLPLPAGRGIWKLCGFRSLERLEPFRTMAPTQVRFDA
ncbi:class I SAM-dependent methyltransferase [[Mycobacterium] kokjensenii]|uniref:Class I SAM-dependent methyltransferase n=1 Tax=[Mycobacterium] kokjensenii TaxID=3064287 RepID=A0ABN9NKD1_9MYCO|nr:class I SAM-dependent methyltransferase [Mycolicibacter sp. MU0083]CAJ1506074.1 class I SAM-dependent methyltransferase [Mycolicibacter sp. MU0083]